MNIFTQQKRFDYGGLFTFPLRGKRCNYTTGFWVSYDLCSSHNNSTTQLGSVINFGKTPKMPYSTKLTFYPGEALIKFEIFHYRWGSQMPKPSNLHTSGLLLPSRSTPPLPPWLPLCLAAIETETNRYFCFFMCRRVIKLELPAVASALAVVSAPCIWQECRYTELC